MISKKGIRKVERGDAMQVVRMSKARGFRSGRGYSFSYVTKCLRAEYRNDDITAMHKELVALRTSKSKSRA